MPAGAGAAPSADPPRPLRFRTRGLRKYWGDHCVTVFWKGLPGGIGSTCWHAQKTGHCPHMYAAQELERPGTARHKEWVGSLVPDADPGAPDVTRAAAASQGSRKKPLLGKALPGVPQNVHVAMSALAADGTIEKTTARQRGQCAPARATVPLHFRVALKYSYIHPAWKAPRGHKWEFVDSDSAPWRLVVDK